MNHYEEMDHALLTSPLHSCLVHAIAFTFGKKLINDSMAAAQQIKKPSKQLYYIEL